MRDEVRSSGVLRESTSIYDDDGDVISATDGNSNSRQQTGRKGAKCHQCVSAVDTEDGKVACARGHFERPITPAGLVRRRIQESAPIPCPDFERRQELRSDVAAYRKLRRERSRSKPPVEDTDDQRQAS